MSSFCQGQKFSWAWRKQAAKVAAAISRPSGQPCITCERGCGYCWEEVMRNDLRQEEAEFIASTSGRDKQAALGK